MSSLGGGGAEKVAINIANSKKNNITLVSLTSIFDYDPSDLKKEVKIITYKEKRTRFSLLKFLFYLRKNRPEYILSTSRDTNLCISFLSIFS